jgi:hypothetical protein
VNAEYYMTNSLMICNLMKYSGDQITKNEMRENVCGLYGGQEGCRKSFCGKT